MNIFILDRDPAKSAHAYVDRHVCKIIVEAAQLLCTAHHMLDGEIIAQNNIPGIYRPTHANHPWALFTRGSSQNYKYVHRMMRCLMLEYSMRYGKVHACTRLWHDLGHMPMNIEMDELGPFPQCMPIQYQGRDVVEAYRDYYFGEKQHIATWKDPAATPTWWKRRIFQSHIAATNAARTTKQWALL